MTPVLLALALQLTPAAPAVPRDIDGAPVDLKNTSVLIVDPDESDEVRTALRAVRAQNAARRGPDAPAPIPRLIAVVDLSDVPGMFHGLAESRIRERRKEVAARPENAKLSITWVVDTEGTLVRRLRGPHRTSCLVVTDAAGNYARGSAVQDLAARQQGRAVEATAP